MHARPSGRNRCTSLCNISNGTRCRCGSRRRRHHHHRRRWMFSLQVVQLSREQRAWAYWGRSVLFRVCGAVHSLSKSSVAARRQSFSASVWFTLINDGRDCYVPNTHLLLLRDCYVCRDVERWADLLRSNNDKYFSNHFLHQIRLRKVNFYISYL